MPGFAGMDTYAFPGADALNWLKANSNLAWCGYYLAPAPSHRDTSWIGKRAALAAAGWGLAPIYVGQQLTGPGSHNVSGPQGAIDGAEAAALMAGEGFAPRSYVYLDLEDGPPFEAPRTDYVVAWARAVAAAGFSPGVYCSYAFARDVRRAVPQARIWAYRVETSTVHPFAGSRVPDAAPGGCGYAGADMWQLGQSCQITLETAPGRLVVDLSTATAPDPCAPDPCAPDAGPPDPGAP